VGLPLEARDRIYRVSPHFAELKRFLEGPLRGWTVHSRDYFRTIDPDLANEYGLGWWEHAFRDAVQLAGYYENGPTVMAYYARLAAEVNQACVEGKLKCVGERTGFMPPLRKWCIEKEAPKTSVRVQSVTR